MNSLEILIMLMVQVFFIDLVIRLHIRMATHYKSAGIISLFLLSISQKQKRCDNKSKATQRVFLSLLLIIILSFWQYYLLKSSASAISSSTAKFLTLIPIFALPFYHFLFDIINIKPLNTEHMVYRFRLRNSVALVLAANIIFIYVNPEQYVVSLAGHLIFCFIALTGLYLLGVDERKRPSSSVLFWNTDHDYLDSEILKYLVSILEISYAILLVSLVFFHGPFAVSFKSSPGFFISFLVFIGTVIFLVAGAKIIASLDRNPTFKTLENVILPISFLLFASTLFIHYYL